MTIYSDSDPSIVPKYRAGNQPVGTISNTNVSLAKAAALASRSSADTISLISESIRWSAQKISMNALNLSLLKDKLNHILHEIDIGSPLVKIQSLIALLDAEVESLATEAQMVCKNSKQKQESVEKISRASVNLNSAASRNAQIEVEKLKVEANKSSVDERPSQLLAQAESASRLKSIFIANMSHEIRTPLAVIKGFAELLQESPSSSKTPTWVDNILRASEQLETLIVDMLDISKIEAGRMDVNVSETNVESLIQECSEFFSAKVQQKGLRLLFLKETKIPDVIATDRSRLKQILVNIIGNAIKFTERGTICVNVKLAELSTGEKRLVFEVIDQGIGIRPDQEQNLFKLFTQADSSITRTHGGTGLGLCLSQQLATLLNGDIKYSPNLPGGSVFTISIDPDLGGMTEATPPYRDDRVYDAGDSLAHTARMLVAEDAPDLAALLEHVLTEQGFSVKIVPNGKQAIQEASRSYYDIILMDLQMPIMDGYEAARQLRLQGNHSPIFALTAHAMNGEQDRCKAAGFDEYFTKPVNLPKLFARISDHLKH